MNSEHLWREVKKKVREEEYLAKKKGEAQSIHKWVSVDLGKESFMQIRRERSILRKRIK